MNIWKQKSVGTFSPRRNGYLLLEQNFTENYLLLCRAQVGVMQVDSTEGNTVDIKLIKSSSDTVTGFSKESRSKFVAFLFQEKMEKGLS